MSPAKPVIKTCKSYVGPQKNNILKSLFEINDGFVTEKAKKQKKKDQWLWLRRWSGSSSNQKVARLTPLLFQLHIQVSLSKVLPLIAPDEQVGTKCFKGLWADRRLQELSRSMRIEQKQ